MYGIGSITHRLAAASPCVLRRALTGSLGILNEPAGRVHGNARTIAIEGARLKVDEHRKAGDLRQVARAALSLETVESLERELKDLLRVLQGKEER